MHPATEGTRTEKPAASAAPSVNRRCEEIPEAEVHAAIGEGARTINDVKRRTRVGTEFCQGIICAPSIVALLHAETGIPPMRPIPLEWLAKTEP